MQNNLLGEMDHLYYIGILKYYTLYFNVNEQKCSMLFHNYYQAKLVDN